MKLKIEAVTYKVHTQFIQLIPSKTTCIEWGKSNLCYIYFGGLTLHNWMDQTIEFHNVDSLQGKKFE
jgi:hypothetical protein